MKRRKHAKQQKPSHHDEFFKITFGRKLTAAEFLRHYLPPIIVALLDLTRLQLEPGSFIDARLRKHFSDLLYRVGLAGGGEAFIYFLLEHKSGPDEWAVLQVLRYQVLTWDRMRKQGVSKLPVISPIIFYHGATPWNVARRLSEQIDWPAGGEELRRYVPECEAYLCDISQYRDEDLVGGDALAAHLRLMKSIFSEQVGDEEFLREIFQETIEQSPEAEASERLETMVRYVTAAERTTQDTIGAAVERAKKGAKQMETIIDVWRKEGNREAVAALTLHLIDSRVGKVDDTMRTQVQAMSISQLHKLSNALFDLHTLEELKQWLARRRVSARKPKAVGRKGRKATV